MRGGCGAYYSRTAPCISIYFIVRLLNISPALQASGRCCCFQQLSSSWFPCILYLAIIKLDKSQRGQHKRNLFQSNYSSIAFHPIGLFREAEETRKSCNTCSTYSYTSAKRLPGIKYWQEASKGNSPAIYFANGELNGEIATPRKKQTLPSSVIVLASCLQLDNLPWMEVWELKLYSHPPVGVLKKTKKNAMEYALGSTTHEQLRNNSIAGRETKISIAVHPVTSDRQERKRAELTLHAVNEAAPLRHGIILSLIHI